MELNKKLAELICKEVAGKTTPNNPACYSDLSRKITRQIGEWGNKPCPHTMCNLRQKRECPLAPNPYHEETGRIPDKNNYEYQLFEEGQKAQLAHCEPLIRADERKKVVSEIWSEIDNLCETSWVSVASEHYVSVEKLQDLKSKYGVKP